MRMGCERVPSGQLLAAKSHPHCPLAPPAIDQVQIPFPSMRAWTGKAARACKHSMLHSSCHTLNNLHVHIISTFSSDEPKGTALACPGSYCVRTLRAHSIQSPTLSLAHSKCSSSDFSRLILEHLNGFCIHKMCSSRPVHSILRSACCHSVGSATCFAADRAGCQPSKHQLPGSYSRERALCDCARAGRGGQHSGHH
eukprot:116208-Pelagomonas_calceolata.AAC.6